MENQNLLFFLLVPPRDLLAGLGASARKVLRTLCERSELVRSP